jgi:hypothetical protein
LTKARPWLGPAVAIGLASAICGSCVWTTLVTRAGLVRARDRCVSLAPGLARADAERALGELDATVIGWSGTGGLAAAPEVDVGRRGTLASWECELSVDARGMLVRTRFEWWIPPDFHGRWDDAAREWIEANLL